ncbi:MAG TPA: PQQ-dependent dehydrogenase, methanol/ethanol family [Burkholderiales bacterium]|nr:PQQ-dependent dehydrogenase, methanol/ethanol family [Burkholderiales bacterium]
MKKLLLSLVSLLFCCTVAQAQTAQELLTDGKNTENVTTYGMGYDLKRFSPLKQINTSNVRRLVPIWNTTLSNMLGEQAQPLVYDGVMYVTNAAWTFAIDVATGKQIWRTAVDYDADTPRVVCCGVSNKGPAIYNGKLYRTTLDAFVVALDMKTGKPVWKEKFAEWKEGYSSIVAPLIANGVLITGMSGAEFGARGFLDGWNPETGKKLWRRYTTPAPGEKGFETWPQDTDAYKRGGGTTWVTGSFDPELDLVYWGTGNTGPWNPTYRKGDSLYTASVIAVRPKTGEIVWHYQFTPDDAYDYDGVNENVIADIRIDGDMRKVIMHADRNGFFYVIDRTNGKLIRGFPFGKVSWATHIDMKTGRPVETDIRKRLLAGEEVELWPAFGVKNWAPMAFNPKTGLVYLNTINFPQMVKFTPVEYKPGVRYTGVEGRPFPRPAGEDAEGYHMAMDPLTGKIKWQVKLTDFVTQAGMLATDGGLVFTGRMTGEFLAFDEATGKILWQFQTGSGVNSPAITYTHKGKQYITVLSGIAGDSRGRKAAAKVPSGGSVWTFALLPE